MTEQATPAANDSGAPATATPAADQGNSAGATTQVNATLREWALDLDQKEVPAGKVAFNVTNAGQMSHNFTVVDSSGVIGNTPSFTSRDGVQTLELDLAPGTYTVICSLPGHAARGQQNTLVVK
jgi:plastocyanin